MLNPKVSILMAVYNCEKYIYYAIKSILEQTYTNFEFIIVNDGSTDNSLSIINSFIDKRITVLSQENLGLSKALNNGLKLCNCELIARMDADDISLPNRIKVQVEFMMNNLEHVMIGSNALVILENGDYLYTTKRLIDEAEIKKTYPKLDIIHPTVMFRKSAVLMCGGYPEEIKHHFEDAILWNRLIKVGKITNIAEPLIKYRITPGSISSVKSKKENKFIYMMLKKIDLKDKIQVEDIDEISKALDYQKPSFIKKYNYYYSVAIAYDQYNNNFALALKNYLISAFYFPVSIKPWGKVLLLLINRYLNLR